MRKSRLLKAMNTPRSRSGDTPIPLFAQVLELELSGLLLMCEYKLRHDNADDRRHCRVRHRGFPVRRLLRTTTLKCSFAKAEAQAQGSAVFDVEAVATEGTVRVALLW